MLLYICRTSALFVAGVARYEVNEAGVFRRKVGHMTKIVECQHADLDYPVASTIRFLCETGQVT